MIRILFIVCLLTGCAQLRITRDESAAVGANREIVIHSFLWAFIPGRALPPVDQMCPGGRVESLDFGMKSQDVMLTAVTLGIYVPHRVIVTCKN